MEKSQATDDKSISHLIYLSDCRQSISQVDADDHNAREALRASQEGREPKMLIPGVVCPADAEHGRMLMSKRTMLLECGICGTQAVPPVA